MPTLEDENQKPDKLDARLAAVAGLPLDTVKEMLAADEPEPERTAGPRFAIAEVHEAGREEPDGERPSGTRFVFAGPREPWSAGFPHPVAISGQGVRRQALAKVDAKAPVLHGIRLDAAGELVVRVLIRFRGDAQRLQAAGARVRRVIGDIATAEVPLTALPALQEDPDVLFIELSQPVRPLVDTSVPAIGVDGSYRGSPPWRGAGTVVGVIDIDGIDFHHPDFSTASDPKRSRIAYLWDQNGPSGGGDRAGIARPQGVTCGAEYSREHIERDLVAVAAYSVVPARPRGAHGTHVTGIAAGNGRASSGRYTGVAPDADIVFVSLRREVGFDVGSSVELCEALEYVFARAGGRPCVVNLSIGTRLGPRDGTSSVERVIDHLVRTPGRAIVVAAGNDGDTGRLTSGPIPARGEVLLTLALPPGTIGGETIQIWYPSKERLDVTVIDPAGARLGPVTTGRVESIELERARVTASSRLHGEESGGNCIEILLQPRRAHDTISPGVFNIALGRSAGRSGSQAGGAYHAAIAGSTAAVWDGPDPAAYQVASPASAAGAIAVGNYQHAAGGQISSTSSRGPTRGESRKPDLSAPGAGIFAPLARGQRGPGVNASYTYMSGTSMAAPHVAGLAALLFEQFGRLDANAMRALLGASVDRTGFSGEWDPAYGRGRVHAPVAPRRTKCDERLDPLGARSGLVISSSGQEEHV